MAVREIRLFGDPVLKTASDPVATITDSVRQLVSDLEETAAIPGRAGVAANQIGVNLRVFSYHVDGKVGHLINPEIIELSGDLVEMDEGCLSLPEIWSKTPRYSRAKVRGQTSTGDHIVIEADGLLAQVLQHEVDHLNGMVYLDRLNPIARKEAMAALRQTSWFLRN